MLVNTVIAIDLVFVLLQPLKGRKMRLGIHGAPGEISANVVCGVKIRMERIGIFKMTCALKEECQSNLLSTIN